VRFGLGDEVGHGPAQRVADESDRSVPEVVEQPKHVVAHRLQRVRTRPVAVPVPPQVHRHHPERPGQRGSQRRPARRALAGGVQQNHHRCPDIAPVAVGQGDAVRRRHRPLHWRNASDEDAHFGDPVPKPIPSDMAARVAGARPVRAGRTRSGVRVGRRRGDHPCCAPLGVVPGPALVSVRSPPRCPVWPFSLLLCAYVRLRRTSATKRTGSFTAAVVEHLREGRRETPHGTASACGG